MRDRPLRVHSLYFSRLPVIFPVVGGAASREGRQVALHGAHGRVLSSCICSTWCKDLVRRCPCRPHARAGGDRDIFCGDRQGGAAAEGASATVSLVRAVHSFICCTTLTLTTRTGHRHRPPKKNSCRTLTSARPSVSTSGRTSKRHSDTTSKRARLSSACARQLTLSKTSTKSILTASERTSRGSLS